ncbi:hypothetical protein ACH347_07595 [Saccharopolyspora sp. 5N102]
MGVTAVMIPSGGADSGVPGGPGTHNDTTTRNATTAPSTTHTAKAGG